MTTLYLWKSHLSFGVKRRGHISLELSNGLYISVQYTTAEVLKFLTTEHFNIVGVEAGPRTLEDDVDFRGRKPDAQVKIGPEYMDQEKIKQFWAMQQNWNESCYSDSCASIVQRAVMHGSNFPVTEIDTTDPEVVFHQIETDFQDAFRRREGSPSPGDERLH